MVGPDARRVGAGLELVGERLPRLHVRARPGDAGDVRAVRGDLVVHAVEVHRVRVARVEVLEVDEDRVAHLRLDDRADEAVAHRRELVLPVGREATVDRRLHRRLRRVERRAHHRVGAARNDVPRRRHRADPVLDRLPRPDLGGGPEGGGLRGRGSSATATFAGVAPDGSTNASSATVVARSAPATIQTRPCPRSVLRRHRETLLHFAHLRRRRSLGSIATGCTGTPGRRESSRQV